MRCLVRVPVHGRSQDSNDDGSLTGSTEIREKFQDLEWRERNRLLQSQQVSEHPLPWAQEQDLGVKVRNRYLNVQPWTKNRIHLKVPPHHNDYINASPIVLTSSKTAQQKKYIATQVCADHGDHLGVLTD